KEIIRLANKAAKPVIVATQMLLSMVDNARPTRAEVTDVANAILDGADAIMFSEETAIGNFPLEVVRTAKRIARVTEKELLKPGCQAEQTRNSVRSSGEIEDMISSATYDVLDNGSVKLAVTPTSTGATARRISRLRPRQWIVAVTDNHTVRNVLNLSFGVLPIFTTRIPAESCALSEFLRAQGLTARGHRLVITAGWPGVPGSTNSLHVVDIV
ncbi:MAG: pyruvate kinase, partial [Desulfobulbaceae bacterium]|nr:pyruvate kinase [Desulfobulbaceae bacterium]